MWLVRRGEVFYYKTLKKKKKTEALEKIKTVKWQKPCFST